ncbi:MAG: hypothetical protein ACTSRG_25470 [Candidatus Helarchaeota archaeon]
MNIKKFLNLLLGSFLVFLGIVFFTDIDRGIILPIIMILSGITWILIKTELIYKTCNKCGVRLSSDNSYISNSKTLCNDCYKHLYFASIKNFNEYKNNITILSSENDINNLSAEEIDIGILCDKCKKKYKIKNPPDNKIYFCKVCKNAIFIFHLDKEDLLKLKLSNNKTKTDKESNAETYKEQKKAHPHVRLATRWLSFYTYYYLPFTILWSLIRIGANSYDLSEKGYYINPITIFLVLLEDIFTCFIIYGLHKRKLWAWFANLIWLGIVVFLGPLSTSKSEEVYFGAVFLLGLLYFLPNYIYFKKRKELFN